MAKLQANDFELSFRITERHDFDPVEYEFKVTLSYKGIPVLNEDVMKRGNEYWNKGQKGGIISSNLDGMQDFIDALEKAVENGEPQHWENYPDADICVSVYPNRTFPYLDIADKSHCTIIFSPSSYHFKDAEFDSGFEGVSFVMSPTKGEYKKFVSDVKAEYSALRGGEKR